MPGQSLPRDRSDDLPDSILHDRLQDFPAVLLPFDQRFAELDELVRADISGHRRLIRIDDGLNDGRSLMVQRLPQDIFRLFRLLNSETGSPATPRHTSKIY